MFEDTVDMGAITLTQFAEALGAWRKDPSTLTAEDSELLLNTIHDAVGTFALVVAGDAAKESIPEERRAEIAVLVDEAENKIADYIEANLDTLAASTFLFAAGIMDRALHAFLEDVGFRLAIKGVLAGIKPSEVMPSEDELASAL